MMIVIGVASIVPMQMSDLPPHARCAINNVDENFVLHFKHLCPAQYLFTRSLDGIIPQFVLTYAVSVL